MAQHVNEQKNKLYLTNNYSIISKYSASKAGYFQDQLLERFIEQCPSLKKETKKKRTPLINRGYAARSLAVEWAVARAIRHESIDCFIVLGSGHDFLAQRHLNECHWIEIDLPEVIGIKAEYIESEWDLDGDQIQRSNNENVIYYPKLCLTLISCDLLRTQSLKHLLEYALEPISHKCRKVAILNEVCLCYSDLSQVNGILSTIKGIVESFCWQLHYIGYEQIRFGIDNQFATFMREHFKSMAYPLKLFPTVVEIKNLFRKDLDFHHITISSMFQIYHNALYAQTQANHINNLEPFDEYEEMDLYLSHYALVTAVRVIKSPFPILTNAPIRRVSECDEEERLNENDEINLRLNQCPIQRLGHSMAAIERLDSSLTFLLSGGFGCDTLNEGKSARHKRLDDCIILSRDLDDYNKWQTSCLDISSLNASKLRLDRMHGRICSLGNDYFLFSGGRQSPSMGSATASNNPFVCRLDEEKLTIEHVFDEQQSLNDQVNYIRWRQGLIKLSNSSVLQCGGLSPIEGGDQDLVILFALDANKYQCLNLCDNQSCSEKWISCFKRHSFASDNRDGHTFALFGGLQADNLERDRPIEDDVSFIMCDLRTKLTGAVPFQLSAKRAHLYGAQMHFITSDQFAIVGGVSCSTGLANNRIDFYDVRNKIDQPVSGQSLWTTTEQPVEGCSNVLIWTNFSSLHLESSREIELFGGGGNYFTFGTHFNQFQLGYRY